MCVCVCVGGVSRVKNECHEEEQARKTKGNEESMDRQFYVVYYLIASSMPKPACSPVVSGKRPPPVPTTRKPRNLSQSTPLGDGNRGMSLASMSPRSPTMKARAQRAQEFRLSDVEAPFAPSGEDVSPPPMPSQRPPTPPPDEEAPGPDDNPETTEQKEKRKRIVQEIVETERDYVKHMETLKNVQQQYLRS